MKERIAIIGTLNMEVILKGIKRYPEFGTQIFVDDYQSIPAGSALRVGLPLRRLGQRSLIIGKVGNDRYGKEIVDAVRSKGLATTGIVRDRKHPTGICISFVKTNGERSFVSSLGAVGETDEKLILDNYHLIERTDFLLITGYWALSGFKEKAKTWRKILGRAKRDARHILLDTGWDVRNWPKKRKDEILRLLPLVDTFLPNREEAAALSGRRTPEEMCGFLAHKGAGEVIIKLGARGAAGYSPREGFHRKKALAVEARDTTAAGEAFNAGILFGLTKAWNLKKRLHFANVLSGLYVSSPENYPTKNEVKKIIEKEGKGKDAET